MALRSFKATAAKDTTPEETTAEQREFTPWNVEEIKPGIATVDEISNFYRGKVQDFEGEVILFHFHGTEVRTSQYGGSEYESLVSDWIVLTGDNQGFTAEKNFVTPARLISLARRTYEQTQQNVLVGRLARDKKATGKPWCLTEVSDDERDDALQAAFFLGWLSPEDFEAEIDDDERDEFLEFTKEVTARVREDMAEEE